MNWINQVKYAVFILVVVLTSNQCARSNCEPKQLIIGQWTAKIIDQTMVGGKKTSNIKLEFGFGADGIVVHQGRFEQQPEFDWSERATYRFLNDRCFKIGGYNETFCLVTIGENTLRIGLDSLSSEKTNKDGGVPIFVGVDFRRTS